MAMAWEWRGAWGGREVGGRAVVEGDDDEDVAEGDGGDGGGEEPEDLPASCGGGFWASPSAARRAWSAARRVGVGFFFVDGRGGAVGGWGG